MKRYAIKLGVFVLAGAIINIAVAWGLACAIDLRDSVPQAGSRKISENWWHGLRWSRFGGLEYSSESRHSDRWKRETGLEPDAVVPAWAADLIPRSDDEPLGRRHWTRNRGQSRGWPMLSLGVRIDSRSDVEHGRLKVRGGIQLKRFSWQTRNSYGEPRMLPMMIIWPGFATNTLLYGVILWLVFAGPRMVRRGWRIKRGRCPVCAYPIGASEVCTECGKPVTPSTDDNRASTDNADDADRDCVLLPSEISSVTSAQSADNDLVIK